MSAWPCDRRGGTARSDSRLPVTAVGREPRRPTRRVEPMLATGVEWVLAGQDRATQRVDGTAVLIGEAAAYERRGVRPGPPTVQRPGFIAVETDPTTGNTVGWAPIRNHSQEDRYYVEAIQDLEGDNAVVGREGRTFELVGSKVQGNSEGLDNHRHRLRRLDEVGLPGVPRAP